MIRIVTIDDHPLIREGIAAVVRTQADMTVVGEAERGEDAVELVDTHRPDVILLDLRLPGIDGIETIGLIRREFPRALVIVLSSFAGDTEITRAMEAGARAYLLKSMLRTELIETIRQVHAGRTRVPAVVAERIAEHLGRGTLTPREIEVLRLVAEGRKNKQIAAALSIAEETVKAHTRNILGKLAADDRTHAVTIAVRRGILHL
ncbi:DNA-binding response regulator [Luteitalea sp. TBR-22]|uniref:response regulator n=1 Tax=Luteitalea sp. TBR-22 TaxID=2802971 RepID=UPI001AFBA045|nr:response regulator transcription factor [Luteitalea sp. TBR-22]BCS35042.1 DNA-binding response regulator [Luteitalea sp. TBR-22]